MTVVPGWKTEVADCYYLEATLCYIVSSRSAWAAKQDHVSQFLDLFELMINDLRLTSLCLLQVFSEHLAILLDP